MVSTAARGELPTRGRQQNPLGRRIGRRCGRRISGQRPGDVVDDAREQAPHGSQNGSRLFSLRGRRHGRFRCGCIDGVGFGGLERDVFPARRLGILGVIVKDRGSFGVASDGTRGVPATSAAVAGLAESARLASSPTEGADPVP